MVPLNSCMTFASVHPSWCSLYRSCLCCSSSICTQPVGTKTKAPTLTESKRTNTTVGFLLVSCGARFTKQNTGSSQDISTAGLIMNTLPQQLKEGFYFLELFNLDSFSDSEFSWTKHQQLQVFGKTAIYSEVRHAVPRMLLGLFLINDAIQLSLSTRIHTFNFTLGRLMFGAARRLSSEVKKNEKLKQDQRLQWSCSIC